MADSPASGSIVIQILKVIERLDLQGSIKDATTIQQIIEVFKFAYVDRMKLGDPDFLHDVEQIVTRIVSDRRADDILPQIDPVSLSSTLALDLVGQQQRTHPVNYYIKKGDGLSLSESHGTTHVTAMDGSGMAVSVTSTVNLEWGCRYMDDHTGIILNNELDDFSTPNANNSFGIPPSPANFIEPGKRPLSSASPLILERDGQIVLVIGAAGGSRIITAVAEVSSSYSWCAAWLWRR